ncbi:hypothetical protein T06_652, partial [Trichinella sp. T6]
LDVFDLNRSIFAVSFLNPLNRSLLDVFDLNRSVFAIKSFAFGRFRFESFCFRCFFF